MATTCLNCGAESEHSICKPCAAMSRCKSCNGLNPIIGVGLCWACYTTKEREEAVRDEAPIIEAVYEGANEIKLSERMKIVAFLRGAPAPCGGDCSCGCCEAAADAIERGEHSADHK